MFIIDKNALTLCTDPTDYHILGGNLYYRLVKLNGNFLIDARPSAYQVFKINVPFQQGKYSQKFQAIS